MGSYEPDEALTDVSLRREIEQALSVRPSPEFLARVRAAVVADSMPLAWPWRWAWLGMTTFGIAVATALLFIRSEPLQVPVLRELPRTHDMSSAAPSLLRLAEPAVHLRSPKPARAKRAKALPKFASEPEVLIAQDEAATLKRLMRGLRHGEVDPSTLDQTRAQPGPPPAVVVRPIPTISPIAIEPLGLEGGARQ